MIGSIAAARRRAGGKSFAFDGTVNAIIELASAVGSAAPLTLCGWCNADSINTALTILSIGGTTARFILGDPNTTGDVMNAQSVNTGGTTRTAAAASSYTPGTWQFFAAVFASATSRTCYQGAVAGTPDTVSNIPSGMTKTTIGGRYSGGVYGQRTTGKLAHIGAWSMALSGSDISSLATPGTLVRTIQPGNLIFDVDLQNGIAKDNVSGTLLTVGSGAISSLSGPF